MRPVTTMAMFVLLVISKTANADAIIFSDRVSFALALDSQPFFAKTVEGWDAYPAGTIFANGSTVSGITYNVSSGEALVVNTGISLSLPNNLFVTRCPTAPTCLFRPLVDTFTFGFLIQFALLALLSAALLLSRMATTS
jgi:hypothetical protein